MLVIPVLLGKVTAVLSIAGVVEAFVTANPELARELFFEIAATSIAGPLRMLARVRDLNHIQLSTLTLESFASAHPGLVHF